MFVKIVPCLVIILIQFASLVRTASDVTWRRWYRDVVFNDLMPVSGYVPDIHVRSKLDCAVLCEKESRCTSFFFAKFTAICQLHDLILNVTNGLDSMPSSIYYYRKNIQKGSVSNFTCPQDDSFYQTVVLNDSSLFRYKVYKKRTVTQSVALKNCNKDGSRLVQLTSSAKMDLFFELLNSCPGFSVKSRFWVDLTNENAANFADINHWVSSSGEALPVANDFWYWNQPDRPNTDHCVALCGKFKFKLCDRHCTSNSYGYICGKNI